MAFQVIWREVPLPVVLVRVNTALGKSWLNNDVYQAVMAFVPWEVRAEVI